MPKQNGLDALREIRRKPLPFKIQIIIFSNSKYLEEAQPWFRGKYFYPKAVKLSRTFAIH